jgi:hypothetical protein
VIVARRQQIDIRHLPASVQRRPEIRALTLRVYRKGVNAFQVPGESRIYEVFAVGGSIHCTCTAALHGSKCAHAIATERFIADEKRARAK